MNKFITVFTGLLLSSNVLANECVYLENAPAVEQYEACPSSKTAALNGVVELISEGDYAKAKAFLTKLRKEHPSYKEVVELLSAVNSIVKNKDNTMELVSVLAKVKMQSLFQSVKLEPFNYILPQKKILEKLELQRGEFEKTVTFEGRKKEAELQRRNEIAQINNEYEKQVAKYNTELKQYKQKADKIIEQHKAEVRKHSDNILMNAFSLVMGEPDVELQSYNPDDEIYYANLTFSNRDDHQRIALHNIPPKQAQAFKSNFSNNKSVDVDIKEELGYLTIANVKVGVETFTGNQDFNFNYTDQFYVADTKAIIIDDGDALLSMSQLQELDINELTSASESELEALLRSSRNAQIAFNNQAANLSQYAINLISKISTKKVLNTPNAVAVIIGNRDYKASSRDIENVEFAINDATLIKAFVKSRLGIAEKDIIYQENTTQSDLNSIFGSKEFSEGKLANYVNDKDTKVFVFYSGHGTLGLHDKYSYLVPVGANPNNIELSGYKLETMYANLSKLPTDDITVVLDACFSGQSNNTSLIKNASAVFGKPKDKVEGKYNFNILSATSSQQIASWDVTNKLGIFTKHFVEGVTGGADKNGDKKVTLAELKKHLSFSVSKEARREYDGRKQTPQVIGRDEKVLSVL